MRSEIPRAEAKGHTFVLVSHDAKHSRTFAIERFSLENGRIHVEGDPERVGNLDATDIKLEALGNAWIVSGGAREGGF